MKFWIITLMCLCGSVVALSGKEGPPPSDKMVALLEEEERNSEKHLSSPPYLLTKPESKKSGNTLLPIATLAFLSLLGVSAYWVGRKKKGAIPEQKTGDAEPVLSNIPPPVKVVEPEEVLIDKRFMEQVEHLFQKQLRDPLFNAEALCLAMNMSKSQFYRKFQESFQQSPGKYIREKRLEAAHTMLANEEGNVSEVAYAVGFNNLSYFAKCFRQQYGFPPSQVA